MALDALVMNREHKETVRSKVAVNLAVYVWAFAAMLVAPALGVSPFAHHVIFYVWLGAAMMIVVWPTYTALRYGTAQRTV